ncbi:hypothetical protein OROGR_008987 [Orobanche gracilis]
MAFGGIQQATTNEFRIIAKSFVRLPEFGLTIHLSPQDCKCYEARTLPRGPRGRVGLAGLRDTGADSAGRGGDTAEKLDTGDTGRDTAIWFVKRGHVPGEKILLLLRKKNRPRLAYHVDYCDESAKKKDEEEEDCPLVDADLYVYAVYINLLNS